MATRVIDDSKLNNIAVAIQAKDNGGQMTVDEMPGRVSALPTNLIPKTITENGVYNASSDNADGYSEVRVEVQPYYNSQGVMYFAEMVIPDTVTAIKASAYQACANMQSLTIPGTVKTIGDYSFQNTRITNLVLNEGIETIRDSAFANHHVSLLVLPKTITSIGWTAFSSGFGYHAVDLSAFTDPSKIPTLANSGAFNIVYANKFFVANQEMLEAFEAATNWSTYAGKYVIKEEATP